MKSALVLFMCVLGAITAQGASSWTVTTADFARQDAEIVSIGPEGVEIRKADVQRVPWREVVNLAQGSAAPHQAKQAFTLATRDGQWLAGKPLKIVDEKLHWESGALGTIQMPLELVRGVLRVGAAFPAGGNEDLAVLQNGDVVHGVIDAGDAEGVTLQKGADKTVIRWDAVRVLLLAEVSGAPADSPARLRVNLADGSTCLADQLRSEGDQLHLLRGKAGDLSVPVASVVSVENLAGRARFLSSIAPSDQQYAPYLPSAKAEQGIRITAGSIELRPQSQISYVVPSDGKLHLRYACIEPGPLTDMSLEIRVAGQTMVKQEGIRSAAPSEAQDLAVRKGQTVQIEVLYGKNHDVQDTLRLLEAAFVGQE